MLPLHTRQPYCLQRARHTLLLRGCLATVVDKRHIAYSMHITVLKNFFCNRGYVASNETKCVIAGKVP
jgi:hypothetical protein